jgi:predicted phosphodiesterase
MVSDLGQTMEATRTMKYLQANKEDIDAIILAGDLAYPNARPDRWDMWFDLLDRFSVFHEVSLQIATGNHDVDITDESGQIFTAYENRFQMPAIQPAIRKPSLGFNEKNPGVPYPLEYDYGNAYYAFTYGIARHVVVSSYSNFDPGSKQYTWLVDELESIDRSVTPWLIVTIHVPIYNTFCKHRKDVQVIRAREYLEPLFVEHHVNIVFSGHVHAYMRTKNVAFGELNDTAPMYIIAGDGGRQAKSPFFNAEPEKWVASRDATIFGFGTIEIFNHTHVKWDWVHTGVASHLNTWRQNENVTFPHGEKDSVYLENQYLLA